MVTAKQLLDIQDALDQLRDFLAVKMTYQAEKQKKLLLEALEPLGYMLKEDPNKYYIIVKKPEPIE